MRVLFTNKKLLGKLFGRFALKISTKDDKQLSKGMPAGKAFTVKENQVNLNAQKTIRMEQIVAYDSFSNDS
jgi:hypothetical protein